MLLFTLVAFDQVKAQEKTVSADNGASQDFAVDTLAKQEVSPLDIADDRGIFIRTKDGKMQLRILGSVRFSVLYDFIDYPISKTFNTYYIPTGDDNVSVPNFSSSLNNSRLGFEITRKLDTKNVFIRLESDFNGSNGDYRIRHAYGQIDNFLVGQTWSLFSNVSSLPKMVDGNGPTGSVTLRTAQARYSGSNRKGTRWAAALEYSRPDLNAEAFDTTGISTVQLIPDVTARIEREGIFGAVQLSGVLTTLSKRDINNNINNTVGFGGSLSGTIDFNVDHKLLYQVTYGKSISHFITTFSGTGMDAVYDPANSNFLPVNSFGGFLSYGFDWTKNLSTNVSGGYAELYYQATQEGNNYKNSMSLSFDTFWDIVDGAQLGIEYVYGQRWDIDGTSGSANRVWLLFYYDF